MRDAQALLDQANVVPVCRSELLENPHEDMAVRRGIGLFLDRDGLKQSPPQLVLIACCGHGMQSNANVYLLPAGADPDFRYSEPSKDFVALSENFKFCNKFDSNARRMVPPRAVRFVILLDACRVRGLENPVASNLDPPSSQAPFLWALCFSCSRYLEAMDGIAGGHSPFAAALLDQMEGIFSKGMPLKTALEAACNRLRQNAGAAGQAPVSVGLHTLDKDLCFFSLEEKNISQEALSQTTRLVKDDENDVFPVVAFLRQNGLNGAP